MDELVKIVVYVPLSHADAVRQALGEAGAGKIGDYSFCSFSSRGIARFKPEEGADPAIGGIGFISGAEFILLALQSEPCIVLMRPIFSKL